MYGRFFHFHCCFTFFCKGWLQAAETEVRLGNQQHRRDLFARQRIRIRLQPLQWSVASEVPLHGLQALLPEREGHCAEARTVQRQDVVRSTRRGFQSTCRLHQSSDYTSTTTAFRSRRSFDHEAPPCRGWPRNDRRHPLIDGADVGASGEVPVDSAWCERW